MIFAICICTFKRPEFLERLIADINKQSILPTYLVVVDGDPRSGNVLDVLEEYKKYSSISIMYVPSNHGNLPYQRYLGWKVMESLDYDILIYIDDDIRITKKFAVSKLVNELLIRKDFLGATVKLPSNQEKISQINELRSSNTLDLLRKMNDIFSAKPGSLTPSGNRILPKNYSSGIAKVEWLQGRLMAIKKCGLIESDFSNDLFSMYELRIGKAEDTYLSRQVLERGKLMIIDMEGFFHPSDSLPTAYPTELKNLGKAIAYSRRFINDHYRINKPPNIFDRIFLLKSYVGNYFINIFKVLNHKNTQLFLYAWGYFLGSIRGLLQKPSAKNLTPDIAWKRDAEVALSRAVKI